MKQEAKAQQGDAIFIDKVTKDFGIYRAVNAISMSIARNEFFTLLGPSGCGKTTLLRMIAGFEWPTTGDIIIDSENVTQLAPNQRPVNTVFQSYALFPHMTVAENIGFGLRMLGKPREDIRKIVDRMLELVHLTGRGDQSVQRLSGGQQQRVALVRALAPQPKVLLLDEPLSALDMKLRKAMQIELKRLQGETGITFVFVTHDQEEALSMSDRIAVMSEGTVRQLGKPAELYDRPVDRFVANFIGETNFVTAELVSAGADLATVRLPSGKTVDVRPGFEPTVGAKVTTIIRPEHTQIVLDGTDAELTGVVRDVVYLGTDTHFHLTLADGTPFVVRQQNIAVGLSTVAAGQSVGVRFSRGALQILKD